jgi:hypothetical protein
LFALCVRTHISVVDLTFVCSTAAPQHSHTLLHIYVRTSTFTFKRRAFLATCTRHECGRTHLCTFERTRAEPLQDLFLGHFFPIPPHTIVAPYKAFPPSPSLLLPNIQILHTHHHPLPPPPPTHHRQSLFGHFHPPPLPISAFSPFFPKPNLIKNSPFFHFFRSFGHNSTLGLCPIVLVLVVCSFCRGLGLFERGFQTLYFWGANQVFDKKPQPTSIMPRGQGSSS